MKRRVVVTGTGLICAAGRGVAPVWQGLIEGQSGLGPLTLFSSPRSGHHLVGEVREDLDRLTPGLRGSRTDRLAWIALQEAIVSAGLEVLLPADDPRLRAPDPTRVALCFGGTVGGMGGTERWLAQRLQGRPAHYGLLRFHECATTADLCAARLGVRGPVLTFSTACSASSMALAAAARLIASGEADVALAGGADALCRLTLNGFGSLLLLDPAGCRPFDVRRTGISLGEGAAFLVLEAEETALARGARVLAALSGWGFSCDAHHATAPHPEGRGALAAMQRACRSAGLEPGELDFVCAHGTATPDNDAMESRALWALCGERIPPVASLMRLTGHTLGASGAVKAVLCVEALRHQVLPPNAGFQEPDPALGLVPVTAATPGQVRHLLSNSFGFGGNNVALVLSKTVQNDASFGARVLAGGSVEVQGPGGTGPYLRSVERLAIVGAGVVSAVGCTVPDVVAAFGRGFPRAELDNADGNDATSATAVRAAPFEGDPALDPARRRRLGRLQQMVLAAARQALPAARPSGERVAVALGTGLGSLGETAAFLENMVLKDEKAPRPAHFASSVHNALAAQVGLEWGCAGLNSTVTQREVSFESALWHGTRELLDQEANLLLAGGADEWSPHLLDVGRRWGWWDRGTHAALPGEGCAAFALARSDCTSPVLGWLLAVDLGRGELQSDGSIDAAAVAGWMTVALARAGVALERVRAVVCGTGGDPGLDRTYRAIGRELSRRAGRAVPRVGYKPACGEFPAASAFGCLVALEIARGTIDAAALAGDLESASGPGAGRGPVVLLTLSRTGGHALCCLEG